MEDQGKMENDRSVKMAKRLKELRIEKGYSHATLSDALDKIGITVSHDSLLNYEADVYHHSKHGKNLRMHADSLLGLAQLYGVSTDYLLCVTDIRNPDPNVAKMVEYLGISEENICLLCALNQTVVGSDCNKDGMDISELLKGSSTLLREIIHVVEGFSSLSPGIGKTIIILIDKLISTIEEDFFNVLHLYHEIEKSVQCSLNQHKDHISPHEIVPLDALYKLNINGFEIMDSSWVRKRSWEELMNILQTGVNAKTERDIADGKRSIENKSWYPEGYRFNLERIRARPHKLEEEYFSDIHKSVMKHINLRKERIEKEKDDPQGG